MKKALFSLGLIAMMLLSVRGFAQTTFTKITSASGLEAGANYLIVAQNDELGVLAMGYQKTNNRAAVVVSDDGGAITVTPGTDATSETDVFQITLGGNEGAWTLFDEVKGGYLYAASSSSNYLKTQTTLDANGQWAITFNEDGTAEVVAQGENTRNNMRFNPNTNNNSPLFSCYAETSTIDTRVSFYKEGGGSVTPDPEPSNYPTGLSALVDGMDVILYWNDPTEGQLPAKYLVLATMDEITVPVDGTPVANSSLAMNVSYGVETVTFAGLNGGTTYKFAIFPYTNSGSNIDYLTSGDYPVVTATTEDLEYLIYEEFNEDLGVFTAYDVYGEEGWLQSSYQGTTFAKMTGYTSGAAHQNEDWLISPEIVIADNEYDELSFEFRTAMKFDGDPLRVVVSMDYEGGAPEEANWIDITDAFDFSAGDYEWVESGVYMMLLPVSGSYHFAFVYTCTDEAASTWEIDYVKLMGRKTVSVNENQTQSVSIYPNPASEQVSFVIDDDAEVSIFDMTGRMVSTTNVAAGQVQLNVSELVNGVYFVNFRYANGSTAVSKFVKF